MLGLRSPTLNIDCVRKIGVWERLVNAPTYTWICHRCEKSNPPNTDKCFDCGFAAIASAEEIDPELFKRPAPVIDSNFWLFFPEGLIAILFLLASPWLFLRLLLNDRPIAALSLVVMIATCSYGFYWSWKHKQKFVAYLVMMCVIGIGFVLLR